MKSILTFDLPEDKDDHTLAIHGSDFYLAIWDLDQWLRSKLKYGHDYKTVDDALEEAREQLHGFLEDRGVSLDMVA